MEQLEDAVSSNDSEIYFAAASNGSSRSSRGQRLTVSVGDHFWSSLGRQGRCYLLRLDALFVPINRQPAGRTAATATASRMASVSVFYPTSYASREANFGLRLKRVTACGADGRASNGTACFGFHRVFAPPVDYELLRHPKPLTMNLSDFFACIGPGMQRHSPEAWTERGLELPDFLASSGQRPRKSGKARVLVLPVSCFNRLQRCAQGRELFGWSREDSLQCIGDNRLFQCACGTRLFFCRRKHPLYHVNRHSVRQEALALKRKGHQQPLTLRSEKEVFAYFSLRSPPALARPPTPQSLPASSSSSSLKVSRKRQTAKLQNERQKLKQLRQKRRTVGKNSSAARAAGSTSQRRSVIKTEKSSPKVDKISRGRKRPAADKDWSASRIGSRLAKRQKKRQPQRRRALPMPTSSPSPPDLSPAAGLTPLESPSSSTAKRRRYRPRLTAAAAEADVAPAATIDSVINRVLRSPQCDGVEKPKTEEPTAFQMHLEAITPPSSPMPQKLPLTLQPSQADSQIQFHRQQYIQQQQQQEQQQHQLLLQHQHQLQLQHQQHQHQQQQHQHQQQQQQQHEQHYQHQQQHQQFRTDNLFRLAQHQQWGQAQQQSSQNLFRLPPRDPAISQQQQQQYQHGFTQQWSQAAAAAAAAATATSAVHFGWSLPSPLTPSAAAFSQSQANNSFPFHLPQNLPPWTPQSQQQQQQLQFTQSPAFVPIFITNPMALSTAGLLNLTAPLNPVGQ